MNLTQQFLEADRQTLAAYTEWLKTNEVCYLPSAVMSVIAAGENQLKERIKNYEKLLDELVQEEYLPFADEEFLEWEEQSHA